MQEIAYGFLGLKPHEFWELDIREYTLFLNGYREREKLKSENELYLLRMLGVWITAPYWDKKQHGQLTPEKLLPLPFDKNEQDKKTLTIEEIRKRKNDLMQKWKVYTN